MLLRRNVSWSLCIWNLALSQDSINITHSYVLICIVKKLRDLIKDLKKVLRGMQSKLWKQLVLTANGESNFIAAKNLFCEIDRIRVENDLCIVQSCPVNTANFLSLKQHLNCAFYWFLFWVWFISCSQSLSVSFPPFPLSFPSAPLLNWAWATYTEFLQTFIPSEQESFDFYLSRQLICREKYQVSLITL